ncbi:MAG: hypothetical protein KC776_25450 [Myxococcales bacterium]|nr:hypothetical protein [Myxococcales bacterium]MCB9581774.1 hypothetical protein [Polyangiaceae bacterium]
MTDRDRAAMDHIHTTGQMLNPAAGLQVSSTGAASPAPGVDHRGAGLTQSQAEIWQARVPRDASSR